MFKHVLVPLDGSSLAEQALEMALKVLMPDGTLTLLSVIDFSTISSLQEFDADKGFRTTHQKEELAVAQANMQAYLRHIATSQLLSSTATIHMKVCTGNPASVIAHLADALHTDVIVMAMHVRAGLSRWMHTSMTKQVLQLASCPVIVVPEHNAVQQSVSPILPAQQAI